MSDDVLGSVSFLKKGVNEISLKCNLVAYVRWDEHLKAIGVAGPVQSVKAAIAMLHDANACGVRLRSIPGHRASTDLAKPRGTKWAVRTAPIGPPGMRLLHAVAWEKSDDSLLLDDSEDSLWGILRSDRFTTPVLREWVPWIRQRLVDRNGLNPLACWNCQVARLVIPDNAMDRIVSAGVADGQLKIPSSA